MLLKDFKFLFTSVLPLKFVLHSVKTKARNQEAMRIQSGTGNKSKDVCHDFQGQRGEAWLLHRRVNGALNTFPEQATSWCTATLLGILLKERQTLVAQQTGRGAKKQNGRRCKVCGEATISGSKSLSPIDESELTKG